MQESEQDPMFPGDFVDPRLKETKDYILKYARAIYNTYAKYSAGGNDNIAQFLVNRRYAEGTQDVDQYKSRMDDKAGEMSAMNLEYSVLPIIPKYVDLLVGEILNIEHQIRCNTIDPISQSKKQDDRSKFLANMISAPFKEEMKAITGMNTLGNEGYTPESKEELELHMEMSYKQEIEITFEEILKYVFTENKWDRQKEKLYRDLVTLARAGVKIHVDQDDNIRVRYVDPVNLITSYSEQDDFSDIRYAGEIVRYDISSIRDMAAGDLSEEELYDIAKSFSGKDTNPSMSPIELQRTYYDSAYDLSEYDNFLVPVLEFEFKSVDTKFYSKTYHANKDGFIMEGKSFGYIPSEKSTKKKEVLTHDVVNVYKGAWIVGTNYVFNYGRKTDITRKKKKGVYSLDAELSYRLIAPNKYEMRNKSLVEKIIPLANEIQIIYLKIQQLLMKVTPPGYEVDIAALSNVMIGKGRKGASPLQITETFLQSGFYYTNQIDQDGNPTNKHAITPLKDNIGPVLTELATLYSFYIQQIRDITGINETRESSSLNKDAPVATQKMSMMASRNATQSLTTAYLKIYEESATEIINLSQDMIVANRLPLWDDVIGTHSISAIAGLKDVRLAELGIFIQALPDIEERAFIEENLQQALGAGLIRMEDTFRIRELAKVNLKHAAQYMMLRSKAFAKEKQEEVKANAEANAIQQQAAQKGAAEAQQMNIQAETQKESQLLQLEYQLKAQLSAQEHKQAMEQQGVKDAAAENMADLNFKNAGTNTDTNTPESH